MIQIDQMTKSFGPKQVFENMSLSINAPGKKILIKGASGSGKTTLFNILLGLDFDYEGQYLLNGQDAQKISQSYWAQIRNKQVKMVFQDYKLIEQLTVKENLQLTENFSIEKIKQMLDFVGLSELINRKCSNLSGGQKQRVAIARALISEPKLLLLDEPTSNLDKENKQELFGLLNKLAEKGICLIIASHDKSMDQIADQVIELKDKQFSPSQYRLSTTCDQLIEGKSGIDFKVIWKFFIRDLHGRWREVLLFFLPLLIIFTFFILGYASLYHFNASQHSKLFAGIGENIILLDKKKVKDSISSSSSSDRSPKLGFSQEELDWFKNLEEEIDYSFIQNKKHFSMSQIPESLNLSLAVKDFPDSLRLKGGYTSRDAHILFYFDQLGVPSQYQNDCNFELLTLLFGDFPQSGSEGILIPDIYAEIISGKEGDGSLVGNTIKLPVTSPDKETPVTKEYQVTGIYKTDYRAYFMSQYPLYLAFEPQIEKALFTKEGYQGHIASLLNNQDQSQYFENSLVDFEHYIDSLGTGYDQVILRLHNIKDQKRLHQLIKDRFPSLIITSQYAFKKSDLGQTYRDELNKLLLNSLLVVAVIGFLIILLNKGYFFKSHRQYAILYSLGYKKLNILQLVWLESSLLIIGTFILAYLVQLLTYQLYYRHSGIHRYLQVMMTSHVSSHLIAFVLVVTCLSIFWNISGINRKKLINYLSGER